MMHRVLNLAISTTLACGTAAVLAAQTPATAPRPGNRDMTPEPAQSRLVTATGCLKAEKDALPRGQAPGDAPTAAGDGFILADARITSAAMTQAAPVAGDPSTPDAATSSTGTSTTGTSSAAAAERARQTHPSGTPGASGAGTSGTESTSVESSNLAPSEAAKRVQPASGAAGGRTMYKVVGMPDEKLREHLNHQVEVQARLDAAAVGGAAAVRQPGTTMGREPASTPSASSPPPASTQAPSTQADRRDEPRADLPMLRAMSIRTIGAQCQGTE